MQPYRSHSGKPSGVIAFTIGAGFIDVKFSNGCMYRYSYASAGKKEVDKMAKLALAQRGLSTYISQNKPGFEQ